MKLAILKKHSQRLSDKVSEFDDALRDAQESFVSSPNMRDTQREELLEAIDSDLSDIDKRVCEIGEEIEKFKKFKSSAGILSHSGRGEGTLTKRS